jgi:hypothetical protein
LEYFNLRPAGPVPYGLSRMVAMPVGQDRADTTSLARQASWNIVLREVEKHDSSIQDTKLQFIMLNFIVN